MTLFLKSFRWWDNVEKCDRARQVTDGDMAYALSMLVIWGTRNMKYLMLFHRDNDDANAL